MRALVRPGGDGPKRTLGVLPCSMFRHDRGDELAVHEGAEMILLPAFRSQLLKTSWPRSLGHAGVPTLFNPSSMRRPGEIHLRSCNFAFRRASLPRELGIAFSESRCRLRKATGSATSLLLLQSVNGEAGSSVGLPYPPPCPDVSLDRRAAVGSGETANLRQRPRSWPVLEAADETARR